jgi:hypothetical protein
MNESEINDKANELVDVHGQEKYEHHLRETYGREWEDYANDDSLEDFKAGLFYAYKHAMLEGWMPS